MSQQSAMSHFKMVMPEHLNNNGSLFGGYLLQWIDEVAYITASLQHPGTKLVTVAMDNVEFKEGIQPGELVRFDVQQQRLGRTSVHYHVSVYGEMKSEDKDKVLFETTISFVNIDGKGGSVGIG